MITISYLCFAHLYVVVILTVVRKKVLLQSCRGRSVFVVAEANCKSAAGQRVGSLCSFTIMKITTPLV